MEPVAVPIAISDGIVILAAPRPPVNGRGPGCQTGPRSIASYKKPRSVEFLRASLESARGGRRGRYWTNV
jgi:hypothetical protein